ncbi:tRNA (guanosine(46)-N7)-methyltransferase TrmB [Silvanigrella aquatica]|uniref:tRNA (guanine-N(7)-)-methyltransferase n=1 Tax=Silvanigrella aquatica TaxID=1915309 RepID=A0A1L4D3X5_9BACT|nr:tRNA (guanosine(46)-N7)-methyltransferase TrmB [Silvanigrella aquatica]APJ04898.1 tRNA (guanosine(46)-N7)-methyltransferase TrmB [Silvanigrella aquatica]
MRKVGTIIDNLRKGEKAPDRHENPYLKEALSLSEYLLTQEELKANYLNLFKNKEKPIVLEIGCYMGKNVIEFALQNPQFNILGIDITYKRVVKAARKLKRLAVDNGKIAICDGKALINDILPENALHGVCVFFPDPWPKDRHEKNRLLKKEFIEGLYQKLAPNGFFWFKTDHEPYYLETNKIVLDCGFKADDVQEGEPLTQPRNFLGGPYETAFQKLFTEKGVPFYQRVYLKK